jgi:hypothetical protein
MPIDLLSTVKQTSQFAFNSPILNNVLGSSIFVAVSITLLVILIIMIMYPAKNNTPFSLICKMFLYILFGSFILVFLHDGVIKHMLNEDIEDKYKEEMMSGINPQNRDLLYGPQAVVRPNIVEEQTQADQILNRAAQSPNIPNPFEQQN